MKAMELYKDILYKSKYVSFGLELVDGYYYIHVDILKKDEHTREEVKKTWIGLQEYLLSQGITELSAMIQEDNYTLKEFANSYGFKKEYEVLENLDDDDIIEIWIAELK